MLTAGPVSRPFTVTQYVHLVPAAAAVFCLSTMEKDIFIPQPFLQLEDVALATTRVVVSNVRCTNRKKNELQRSPIDENRALARFSLITTPEAATNELPSFYPTRSSLAIGKVIEVSSQRTKRKSFELHSSKNGGERALASSLHRTAFTKVKKTAKAPPVWRNQQLTLSIDSASTLSARRSFEMLNELCSSKPDEKRVAKRVHHSSCFIKTKTIAESPPTLQNKHPLHSVASTIPNSARRAFEKWNEPNSSRIEGERVVSSSPHRTPSILDGKITASLYQLPLNKTESPAFSSTIERGPRCFVDKSKEPSGSKNDGELASASSLSKELSFYRVSHLPLSECQPGCHYKSWLLQARNHVRWKGGLWLFLFFYS